VRKAGLVVLVEGESDCHTLWLHEFPALGLPGAGNWNEGRDAPLLADVPEIFVVIEPDKGGEAVMKWLRNSSIAPRVKLVRIKDAKDPSALSLADPHGFAAAFHRALDDAEPFSAITDREARAESGMKPRLPSSSAPGKLSRNRWRPVSGELWCRSQTGLPIWCRRSRCGYGAISGCCSP
jgi:DNA primase